MMSDHPFEMLVPVIRPKMRNEIPPCADIVWVGFYGLLTLNDHVGRQMVPPACTGPRNRLLDAPPYPDRCSRWFGLLDCRRRRWWWWRNILECDGQSYHIHKLDPHG